MERSVEIRLSDAEKAYEAKADAWEAANDQRLSGLLRSYEEKVMALKAEGHGVIPSATQLPICDQTHAGAVAIRTGAPDIMQVCSRGWDGKFAWGFVEVKMPRPRMPLLASLPPYIWDDLRCHPWDEPNTDRLLGGLWSWADDDDGPPVNGLLVPAGLRDASYLGHQGTRHSFGSSNAYCIGRHVYATMDFAKQQQVCCEGQLEGLPMPPGWEIAPYDRRIVHAIRATGHDRNTGHAPQKVLRTKVSLGGGAAYIYLAAAPCSTSECLHNKS
eukprot:2235608-Prymnesium_polylepis.1